MTITRIRLSNGVAGALVMLLVTSCGDAGTSRPAPVAQPGAGTDALIHDGNQAQSPAGTPAQRAQARRQSARALRAQKLRRARNTASGVLMVKAQVRAGRWLQANVKPGLSSAAIRQGLARALPGIRFRQGQSAPAGQGAVTVTPAQVTVVLVDLGGGRHPVFLHRGGGGKDHPRYVTFAAAGAAHLPKHPSKNFIVSRPEPHPGHVKPPRAVPGLPKNPPSTTAKVSSQPAIKTNSAPAGP
jgi:hypothetical protein